MGLGIITLFFLVAFSLFYIGQSLEQKPEWLAKATETITTNIDALSFWGMVYSLVSAVLLIFAARSAGLTIIAFIANAVLFLLALPYALDGIVEKHGAKLPAGLTRELKNTATAVAERKKVMGYIGAGFSFLLFVFLTR